MSRRIVSLAAVLIALLATQQPASATPGQISWTTWFRIGPGRNYAVRDEINNGTVLDVVGCQNGWCQVVWGNRTGYVESDVVVQPVPVTKPASPHDCVQNRRSGYGSGDELSICQR